VGDCVQEVQNAFGGNALSFRCAARESLSDACSGFKEGGDRKKETQPGRAEAKSFQKCSSMGGHVVVEQSG